jgi:hypothetical protein
MLDEPDDPTKADLQEKGFFPAWVEDLQDGMRACIIKRSWHPDEPDKLTFHDVKDVRIQATVQYGGEHDDEILGGHKIIRWFGIDDDGIVRDFSYGEGHAVYIYVPE